MHLSCGLCFTARTQSETSVQVTLLRHKSNLDPWCICCAGLQTTSLAISGTSVGANTAPVTAPAPVVADVAAPAQAPMQAGQAPQQASLAPQAAAPAQAPMQGGQAPQQASLAPQATAPEANAPAAAGSVAATSGAPALVSTP